MEESQAVWHPENGWGLWSRREGDGCQLYSLLLHDVPEQAALPVWDSIFLISEMGMVFS